MSTRQRVKNPLTSFWVGSILVASFLFSTNFTVSSQTVEIDSLRLREHITFLADDAMEGREAGKTGNRKSGEYIANEFRRIGATPLFDNGFQYFQLRPKVKFTEKTQLSIDNIKLEVSEDFLPSTAGANATSKGEIVFVGFGISVQNDTIQWNDYSDVDVKGKWVMLIDDTPYRDDFFRLTRKYKSLQQKVILAQKNGAAGVIVVPPSNRIKKSNEIGYFRPGAESPTSKIPVVSITRKHANSILKKHKIETIEKEFSRSKLTFTEVTKSKAKGTVEIERTKLEARNVVFQINSATPSNEYVVIGGHYDHVGRGFWGSRARGSHLVHNGADDNASGTAGVIELARYFQSKKDLLTKNLVFVAFDAEEMGLIGSKYFVANSPMPTEQIKVMFNFDMIARMKHDTVGITIRGTGTAKEFGAILDKHKPHFKVVRNPAGNGPTDHSSFYKADIPVLSMSTGLHPEYHTPLDDVKLCRIDKEKEVLDYAALLIEEFALEQTPLTFVKKEVGKSNRVTQIPKVKLGVLLKDSLSPPVGISIVEVVKNGFADKVGITKEDVIMSINGKKVSTIEQFRKLMVNVNPKDTVTFEYLRAGETKTVEIKF